MKRVLILLLLLVTGLFAEEKSEGCLTDESAPCEVNVGLYLSDIYDVNWKEGSYKGSFWVWYDYTDIRLEPDKHLDLIDASDIDVIAQNGPVKRGDLYHLSTKYDATFHHDWDLLNYPFIRQDLEIIIENIEYDTRQLLFKPDVEGSKLDPAVRIAGWKIEDFTVREESKEYDTDFGDEFAPDKSSYSRIIASVHVSRTGLRNFFQLFGVMYLAYLLSVCVYFLPTQEMSSKMALLAGSIFAAIGNKFVIDSYLPPISGLALSDKLQILTFAFFLITVVTIVVSSNMRRYGRDRLARRTEITMAMISITFYVLINFSLVKTAL